MDKKTPGPPMTEAMFARVMGEAIALDVPMEEVVRRALEGYFFLRDEVRAGHKILITDGFDNKLKEIVYKK